VQLAQNLLTHCVTAPETVIKTKSYSFEAAFPTVKYESFYFKIELIKIYLLDIAVKI